MMFMLSLIGSWADGRCIIEIWVSYLVHKNHRYTIDR